MEEKQIRNWVSQLETLPGYPKVAQDMIERILPRVLNGECGQEAKDELAAMPFVQKLGLSEFVRNHT